MNFRKERTEEYSLFDTNIPNIFIGDYMLDAPGDYVKVYLFAIMNIEANLIIDNEDIAKHLGMALEDVYKAWTYWEDVGVVRKHHKTSNDKFNYEVEILDLKSLRYGNNHDKKPEAKNLKNILEDDSVKKLYKDIEKKIGQFGGNDIQTISLWMDRYDMSTEVIAYAFEYADKNWEKVSVNSVGNLIMKWAKQDIHEIDALKDYLINNDKRHNGYKRIMQAAGKPYNVTPNEKETIDMWIDEWGYEVEDIVDRFKKTDGTVNPFAYVKKILQKEHEKGDDPKLRSSFVSEVYDYYAQIRERNEKEAEARRKKAYSSNPRIKDIDIEIRGIGMEIPKVILSGADNANEKAASLNSEIEVLQKKKGELLEAAGLPVNYMEITYLCSECKDTGILDSGERCECFTKRMSELRI